MLGWAGKFFIPVHDKKYSIPIDTGTQTDMLFSIVLSAVLIRPKKN